MSSHPANPAPPPDLTQFDGHTPGPWRVQYADNPYKAWIYAESNPNRNLAVIYGRDYADGALVAAAPALLAECQRLQEVERDLKRAQSRLRQSGNAARRAAIMEVAQREDTTSQCEETARLRGALDGIRRKAEVQACICCPESPAEPASHSWTCPHAYERAARAALASCVSGAAASPTGQEGGQ